MEPESSGQEPGISDRSLLRRYRGGNERAAAELYRRYAQRLHALARAQLSADLSRRVDVDDIVQSVFGSFFRGVSEALYDVPAGEELWKLLLVIALNKIRKKAAHHHAARRDSRRTTALEPSLAALIADQQAADDFLRFAMDEALAALATGHRLAARRAASPGNRRRRRLLQADRRAALATGLCPDVSVARAGGLT
jgi:RNA polymerase sigma-70 factor (ECF subfamily)